MSKPANEFNIEDLFGTVSASFHSNNSNISSNNHNNTNNVTTTSGKEKHNPAKYPNTVPFAKAPLRSSIFGDIFDNSSDYKHSSATVAVRRNSKNNNNLFSFFTPNDK